MPLCGFRLSRCLFPFGFVLLCGLFVSATPGILLAQEHREPGNQGMDESALDSLAEEVRKAAAEIKNPLLEERKATRRLYQQRGYVEILCKTITADGLGALLAYLRSELRLEVFLPRNTIYTYVNINVPALQDSLPGRFARQESGPFGIPLPEDRTFPADPWSKP